MRRAAGFALVAFLLLAVIIVGLAWLLSTLLGAQVLGAILPTIALVIASFVAVRLLRGIGGTAAPLGDLIDAAERVEAGEMGVEVAVRGPREIRALARAFNAMSGRLAATTDARRTFLADVSHELRTPITVIQGSVEGMLDGLYPADRKHLERLLEETRQLERLVEDLRTLALTDAGALRLHREATDLATLAAEVVAGFEPQAAAAEVSLAIEADEVPAAPLDPRRMRQVITNLVANAIRHTPPGGSVAVTVRPDAGTLDLVVADTGRGMDDAAASRAFERFWSSGDTAGAGLGLAIVRDLVRAHGGDVRLESAPGRGTTIHCRLPADATAVSEDR